MDIAKLYQTQPALFELDQTALAEAAETSAGRLLDQIDRELQHTDFLRIIDALDDRAEWLAGFFHLRSGLSNHHFDRSPHRFLGHSGSSKLETVTQHWHHRGLLAQTLDVRCAFSPKPSSNKRQ